MFIICLMIAVVVACGLHRRAMGRALFHSGPGRAEAFTALFTGWVYILFYLGTGRAALAGVLTLLVCLILWAADEAKKTALRGEPLVFADVSLLGQVVNFPGLYVPFLPGKCFVAGGAAAALICVPLWLYEEGGAHLAAALFWLALPGAFVLFLRTAGGRLVRHMDRAFPLTFDAVADADSYGPLGAAMLHSLHYLTPHDDGIPVDADTPPSALAWPAAAPVQVESAVKPDIVLVQAESFCDPRPLDSRIPADLLKNYDTLCACGLSGDLEIQAFGAYTMRTEFSVLSGLEPENLGADSFNPYITAGRRPVWTLARYLNGRGYRTVCVHPFARKFFRRHKVMPNMGFERFITQENFPHNNFFGPYISDAAVAAAVRDILHDGDPRPLFCFVITMESHGPWRGTRFTDEEVMGCGVPRTGFPPELWRYLVHLGHCDAMIGALAADLTSRHRPALFGLYGDHLPNLPLLTQKTDRATPYVVWDTRQIFPAERKNLRPGELGGELLQRAR